MHMNVILSTFHPIVQQGSYHYLNMNKRWLSDGITIFRFFKYLVVNNNQLLNYGFQHQSFNQVTILHVFATRGWIILTIQMNIKILRLQPTNVILFFYKNKIFISHKEITKTKKKHQRTNRTYISTKNKLTNQNYTSK